MEKKVYRSRISVFMLIFWGVLFVSIGYKMSSFYGSFFHFGSYILVASCVFGFFCLRSLYYVVQNKEIRVYYMWGFYDKPFGSISISAITSVERSYNPLFAPAASMKRLRFRFKKGYKGYVALWLSPVREKEFLETLKTLNPNIQNNVTDKKGWWRFWDWDI